jgi:hypothetical protein
VGKFSLFPFPKRMFKVWTAQKKNSQNAGMEIPVKIRF